MSTLSRALLAVNRSSLWQHQVRIGQDQLCATSLDRLIYLWRHKFFRADNAEARFLRACLKSGMHVVDVGANVGAFAHMFAHAVGPMGRVTAFEPDPMLFAALEASARTNGLVQIFPQRLALGAESGRGCLNQGLFNSGDNRMEASREHSTASSINVPIVTLDEFLDGRPVDFIKMDIQGWELNALRGMEKTLAANPRLQLYIELWPYGLKAVGTSPQDLFAVLTAHGFVFEIRPGNPVPTSMDFTSLAQREYWFADVYAHRP